MNQPTSLGSYSIYAPGFSGVAVLAFAHGELPGSLTRILVCRCQSDGPFRLNPEEVESGQFMSLQVQTFD